MVTAIHLESLKIVCIFYMYMYNRACLLCSIQLLQEVNSLGRDNMYVCQKPQPKTEQLLLNMRSPQAQDGGSSDEEDEEEELAPTGNATTTQDVESGESKSNEQ